MFKGPFQLVGGPGVYPIELQFTSRAPEDPFYFVVYADALTLVKNGDRKGISVDFAAAADVYKSQHTSAARDLHARAVGLKAGLRVADLTLGLATDAFKLAYLGADVTGFESHPAVYALAADGLRRYSPPLAGSLRLLHRPSQYLTDAELATFAVFYLDPMYSHRRRALPKKEMQYLAELVDASGDEPFEPLVDRLLGAGKRLVIKRARQAPHFAGRPPRHSLESKMVRFDLY